MNAKSPVAIVEVTAMPIASVALRPLVTLPDAVASDSRHAADAWRAGKKKPRHAAAFF
ncbi:hypothetical protein [Xanthomonas prunicola]|jgi:predicted methyltransferase|uniref:hypothetical protein n=1 Tax=Xanthomonas prunicola TaxID=2053930 RepID=UPI0012FFF8DC|nr:hypothetical protein [Xanthomonas prunicola]